MDGLVERILVPETVLREVRDSARKTDENTIGYLIFDLKTKKVLCFYEIYNKAQITDGTNTDAVASKKEQLVNELANDFGFGTIGYQTLYSTGDMDKIKQSALPGYKHAYIAKSKNFVSPITGNFELVPYQPKPEDLEITTDLKEHIGALENKLGIKKR
jgi:hypothetical protein